MSDTNNPVPIMYRKNNKTGADIKLPEQSAKNKIIRALLNRFYKQDNKGAIAFIPHMIDKTRLFIAINLLCHKIRPDNPASAFYTAIQRTKRLYENRKACPAGVGVVGAEGGEVDSSSVRLACCPHCLKHYTTGHDEPHWYEIYNGLDVDKYGHIKHK